MKKLMIAAAAGALSLVSSAAVCNTCCNTCDTCSTDCVYAYEFILLAKSTEGKPVTQVAKPTCACECETTICGSKCYRKPRMRKYAGFVAGRTVVDDETEEIKKGCASGCTCFDFARGCACVCGSPADLPFYDVAEENDDEEGSVWGGQLFWDVRTKKAVEASLWFYQLDAIGYQSRETVEAVGQFALKHTLPPAVEEDENDDEEGESKIGIVTLAGFGKRGKRSNGVIMVKNLSGFFAGQLPVWCESCSTTKCEQTCSGEWAVAWTICDDVEYTGDADCWGNDDDDDEGVLDPNWGLTAAYGKWTLKWNATAVAKLTKNYSASVLVKPGYDGSIAAKTTLKGAPEPDEDAE